MKKYLKYVLLSAVIILALVFAWQSDKKEITTTEGNPEYSENIAEEELGALYEKMPEESIKTDFSQEEMQETVSTEQPPEEKIEESIPKKFCTIMVECTDILEHISDVPLQKQSFIPQNGIIYSGTDIEFSDGDSVFDVLKRELMNLGIPLEFSLTPLYNSVYIEGINNLYELDCGERSGWKYSVNGKYPPVASSEYKLKKGDKVTFSYKKVAY